MILINTFLPDFYDGIVQIVYRVVPFVSTDRKFLFFLDFFGFWILFHEQTEPSQIRGLSACICLLLYTGNMHNWFKQIRLEAVWQSFILLFGLMFVFDY